VVAHCEDELTSAEKSCGQRWRELLVNHVNSARLTNLGREARANGQVILTLVATTGLEGQEKSGARMTREVDLDAEGNLPLPSRRIGPEGPGPRSNAEDWLPRREPKFGQKSIDFPFWGSFEKRCGISAQEGLWAAGADPP
jgi:hypothetical protein